MLRGKRVEGILIVPQIHTYIHTYKQTNKQTNKQKRTVRSASSNASDTATSSSPTPPQLRTFMCMTLCASPKRLNAAATSADCTLAERTRRFLGDDGRAPAPGCGCGWVGPVNGVRSDGRGLVSVGTWVWSSE
jgi:hypothetical protein